jgi:hypothetical protein
MDFNYTDTQDMLRDTLARFLADTYDFESRKKMIASDAGRDPGIWRALATELGILSAPFSEEQGGLGGGAIENLIMMEELGKVIAIEPYLQTVVIGGGALKASGGAFADAVVPKSSVAMSSSALPMQNPRVATTLPTSRRRRRRMAQAMCSTATKPLCMQRHGRRTFS